MRGRSFVAVLTLSFLAGVSAVAQTPPIPVYLSEEQVANTVTTGNQRRPAVAGNVDGNVLIVWHSDAAQAGFFDIKGQLFDREGDPVGGEFQVDQAGANRIQYTPQAAAGGNGNYIAVWADFNQTVTDSEIWVRRYDSAGNALAAAQQVNTFTTGQQRRPRVAANDAGQFVVVWESDGQDGSGFGIFARLYDSDGVPSTLEIPVNTVTTGSQTAAAVDIDDDVGFTVVFNDANTGVEARDIGLTALNGPSGMPQYNLFDASHRNADIAYVASAIPLSSPGGAWSNFWAVAENNKNGLISFRSRRNWTLDPPSPIGVGFNTSLAATQLGGFNVGFLVADQLNTGSTYDYEIVKFREIPNVSLSLDRWTVPRNRTSPSVPDVGISGGYQGFVAGGVEEPIFDGLGAAIAYQRGGDPDGLRGVVYDTPAVFRPSISAQFGFQFRNNSLSAALTYDGNIAIPLADAPSGGGLTINDGTADYGTIPAGAFGDCQATGDCYNVTPNGPRPGPHWDEAVTETLSTGVDKTWLLHVGDSFADVPSTNLFYELIENLFHNGITAGGACGGYCPADGVKRQQMAVFLLKSRFGSSFVPPPATGTIFGDVPASNPFAAWIEALYLLGVTGGCQTNPLMFCPDAIVNRQQMAAFLLKTKEGSAYTPPACTNIFQDVPCSNLFSAFIEELYNRQVTGGCATNPLRYCPTNETNRQQMAAFLVKTFDLLLYGP